MKKFCLVLAVLVLTLVLGACRDTNMTPTTTTLPMTSAPTQPSTHPSTQATQPSTRPSETPSQPSDSSIPNDTDGIEGTDGMEDPEDAGTTNGTAAGRSRMR